MRNFDPGHEGRIPARGHRRGQESRRREASGGRGSGRTSTITFTADSVPTSASAPWARATRPRTRPGRTRRRARGDHLAAERGAAQRLPDHPGNQRAHRRPVAGELGSVYPAISQLEDEGLIEPADGSGRKLFALTQAGRSTPSRTPAPRPALEGRAEDGRFGEFLKYRELIGQLAAATRQVGDVGTQAQRQEARQVLIRPASRCTSCWPPTRPRKRPSGATTTEMPPRAVEDYLRTIQALDDDGVHVIQAA